MKHTTMGGGGLSQETLATCALVPDVHRAVLRGGDQDLPVIGHRDAWQRGWMGMGGEGGGCGGTILCVAKFVWRSDVCSDVVGWG